MSMARTKELLTVPQQGVLKGLNTSLAAAILRDPPKTNQTTTERKEGRFRREIGSHLFRRMTRARFASLLGTRNPTPDDARNKYLPRADDVHDKTKDVETKRQALLVGITYSSPTNTWSQLDGPHGDLDQYRDLLISA
jgi:hypothetical protein